MGVKRNWSDYSIILTHNNNPFRGQKLDKCKQNAANDFLWAGTQKEQQTEVKPSGMLNSKRGI